MIEAVDRLEMVDRLTRRVRRFFLQVVFVKKKSAEQDPPCSQVAPASCGILVLQKYDEYAI